MKRILLLPLAALGVLASQRISAQACPTVCPEKISVDKACDVGPSWWRFHIGYINPTNGTKSIRVYEENGLYDTVFDISGHKDQLMHMTSKPFYSTANPPKLHWKTYTGTMGNGTACDGDILPVKFISVKAKSNGNVVTVNCDLVMDNFVGPLTLERSYNGSNFETIATLTTSEQQTSYVYEDHLVPDKNRKIVFYRFKGEGKYSAIASAALEGGKSPMHVFNGTSLSLYNIPVNAKVSITTAMGQQLFTTTSTYSNLVIPFTNHGKGTYFFKVIGRSGETYEGKFLIIQ